MPSGRSKNLFHVRGEAGSDAPFSPAVRAGDFVFVSGQASVDDQGSIIHDTFEAEMRRSIQRVASILATLGLTLQDVVQVRSYLASQDDLAEYNRVYREFFRDPRPARTTLLGVLGNIVKYEIDVVAYAGK